jgi:uncharacterized protein (DUF427 family)
MPWLPELFTAPALEHVQEQWQRELASVPFFRWRARRVDIRGTSRHLIASHGDRIVADTHARLVLYESGFAPRWYASRAAWSYRAPFEEVARIAELVSFYPAKVTVAIDRKRLEEAPPQNVIAHEDVFAADA